LLEWYGAIKHDMTLHETIVLESNPSTWRYRSITCPTN